MKKYRVAVADTLGEEDLRNGNIGNVRNYALNAIIISEQLFYEEDRTNETIGSDIDELIQANPNFRFKYAKFIEAE
jgi:hypothetical protein